MSDNTNTAPLPQRWLKSPFNGELWPCPPDLTPAQYDYMVQVGGFIPVEPAKPKRAH